MKDIYELLNEVSIDEEEFKEMEVSEFEKAKVKSTLKKSLTIKKKRNAWKVKVVAAAMVLGLSVTTIGVAFPAYAGNLPIIGDVFKFLDIGKTGVYDNYKEFSTEMNMVQESNGIKMTISDAVFDGNTVSVAYSIESDKDLDEEFIWLRGSMFDIKGASSMIGSFDFSKVDDRHYVALSQFTPLDFPINSKKAVDINWKIDSFLLQDPEKLVEGDWEFAFSLKSTDNQVQLSNQSSERNGVNVTVDKLTITPMSFIVHYNHNVSERSELVSNDIDLELEIRDDLGKVYVGEGNGGTGNDYTMNWSKTFEKLDPKATKLIVTPMITSTSYDTNGFGGEERTENGVTITTAENTSVSNFTSEEFVLEDIVIELEK